MFLGAVLTSESYTSRVPLMETLFVANTTASSRIRPVHTSDFLYINELYVVDMGLVNVVLTLKVLWLLTLSLS